MILDPAPKPASWGISSPMHQANTDLLNLSPRDLSPRDQSPRGGDMDGLSPRGQSSPSPRSQEARSLGEVEDRLSPSPREVEQAGRDSFSGQNQDFDEYDDDVVAMSPPSPIPEHLQKGPPKRILPVFDSQPPENDAVEELQDEVVDPDGVSSSLPPKKELPKFVPAKANDSMVSSGEMELRLDDFKFSPRSMSPPPSKPVPKLGKVSFFCFSGLCFVLMTRPSFTKS